MQQRHNLDTGGKVVHYFIHMSIMEKPITRQWKTINVGIKAFFVSWFKKLSFESLRYVLQSKDANLFHYPSSNKFYQTGLKYHLLRKVFQINRLRFFYYIIVKAILFLIPEWLFLTFSSVFFQKTSETIYADNEN